MTGRQEEIFERVREALVNFDAEAARRAVLEAVQLGLNAEKVVEAMSEGMNIVGSKYEDGEYFLPDLIVAGETMKEALEVLKPYMKEEVSVKLGIVLVASVAGDLHDIGKNVFAMLATTAGFNVVDLGVDVSAETIVQAVKDYRVGILGLSSLLTTTQEQFPLIVEKLKKEGLRDKVKVIVGGATVTEEFAKEARVDAYAKTALAGVNICKGWAKEGLSNKKT